MIAGSNLVAVRVNHLANQFAIERASWVGPFVAHPRVVAFAGRQTGADAFALALKTMARVLCRLIPFLILDVVLSHASTG